MVVTNTPFGLDERPPQEEWTPARGLRRGAIAGAAAAAIIAAVLAPLALKLPLLVIPFWLRIPLAYGIAWILLRVVWNAAGMAGALCNGLAFAFAALVLLSHHVLFAAVGIPSLAPVAGEWFTMPALMMSPHIAEVGGKMIGAGWLHPASLFAMTGVPLIVGAGLCVVLHREP